MNRIIRALKRRRLFSIFVVLLAIVSSVKGDDSAKQKLSPDRVKQQRKEAAAHAAADHPQQRRQRRPHRARRSAAHARKISRCSAPPPWRERKSSSIFYCTGVFNFYSHHSDETEPLKYVTEQYHDQGWELGTRGPDTLEHDRRFRPQARHGGLLVDADERHARLLYRRICSASGRKIIPSGCWRKRGISEFVRRTGGGRR